MKATMTAFVAVFLTVLATVNHCNAASEGGATSVEIWRVGDDGLTTRLAEAATLAFARSGLFLISQGHAPGSLYVGIQSNVAWTHVGPRTRITAQIEIANAPPGTESRKSSMQSVSCWESDLASCANAILDFALSVRSGSAEIVTVSIPESTVERTKPSDRLRTICQIVKTAMADRLKERKVEDDVSLYLSMLRTWSCFPDKSSRGAKEIQ